MLPIGVNISSVEIIQKLKILLIDDLLSSKFGRVLGIRFIKRFEKILLTKGLLLFVDLIEKTRDFLLVYILFLNFLLYKYIFDDFFIFIGFFEILRRTVIGFHRTCQFTGRFDQLFLITCVYFF